MGQYRPKTAPAIGYDMFDEGRMNYPENTNDVATGAWVGPGLPFNHGGHRNKHNMINSFGTSSPPPRIHRTTRNLSSHQVVSVANQWYDPYNNVVHNFPIIGGYRPGHDALAAFGVVLNREYIYPPYNELDMSIPFEFNGGGSDFLLIGLPIFGNLQKTFAMASWHNIITDTIVLGQTGTGYAIQFIPRLNRYGTIANHDGAIVYGITYTLR